MSHIQVSSPWVGVPDAAASELGPGWCEVSPALAASLRTSHTWFAALATGDGMRFTREPVGVRAEALVHLDEQGVVKLGARVAPGDLLVGCVKDGDGGERDVSLVVAPGVFGVVVDVDRTLLTHAEHDRAAIVVAFDRPLEVGDQLVDDTGATATVAAIGDLGGPTLRWPGRAPGHVALRRFGRDQLAPKLGDRWATGEVSEAQVTALAEAGLGWCAWECAWRSNDAERERVRDALARGEHPTAPPGWTAPPGPRRVLSALHAIGLGVDGDPAVGLTARWLRPDEFVPAGSAEVTDVSSFKWPTDGARAPCHLRLPRPLPHPLRLEEVGAALGVSGDTLRRMVSDDGVAPDPIGPVSTLCVAVLGADSPLLVHAVPIVVEPVASDWSHRAVEDGFRRARAALARVESVLQPYEQLASALARTEPDLVRHHLGQVFAALCGVMDPTLHDPRSPRDDPRPVESCGSAVWVCGPIAADRCQLPAAFALELFRPWVAAVLGARDNVSLPDALRMVDVAHPAAHDAVVDLVEVWPVLVASDRAVVPLRAEIGTGAAIVLPAGLGDLAQPETPVSVLVPVSVPAVAEVLERLGRPIPVTAPSRSPTGWFTALLQGAPITTAAVGETDLVDDEVVRVVLGQRPPGPMAGVPWSGWVHRR